MKYKVIMPVEVMGKKEGEVFEAEPHAVYAHLEKGEIEVYNEPLKKELPPKPKKIVKVKKTLKKKK